MGGGLPRAVVFDLDGTLVDSAADIALALNAGLAEEGLAPHPVDAVKRMIGGGIRLLVERALEAGGHAIDAERSAAIVARVLGHYRRVPVRETTVYPGGRALIAALRAQGVALGICTNKPEDITHQVLAGLGLTNSFAAVVGGRDDLPKKPDPAMMQAVMKGLGTSASEVVMVGDSHADVGAARAVGMPVMLVSHGYTVRPARELGADLVVDGLGEVWAAIGKMRERG